MLPVFASKTGATLLIIWTILLFCKLGHTARNEADPEREKPHVFVVILSRNQAHTLRNFLGYLERLDYPKHRISIWIRTDHNDDNTTAMLHEWSQNARLVYANIDFVSMDAWLYPVFDPFAMPEERYLHVTQLRQQGLDAARKAGADYLFSVDCDNFLVNNQTLLLLLEQKKPIIAPMLVSGTDSVYSNFWCGQDEKGYYKRTPDYLPTYNRERVGCFQVPVVHSTFLIDLRDQRSDASHQLAYWPAAEGFTGPVDDIVQFAYSAKKEGLGMYILNTEYFGHLLRPATYSNLEEAANEFTNFKLQTLVFHPPVPVSEFISAPDTPKDRLGLDAVFMISLVRRPDRRNRMLACLDNLNFNYTVFDAVDGRQLNQSYIDGLGIHYLPGWKDPWGERPMTFGEVGCFLSHYNIWQKMLAEGLQEVLILEDDVDFAPNFRNRLELLLKEAHSHTPSWDLIYIGRKALHWRTEKLVPGTSVLVRPDYSYWTLGYLISHRGVRKLIDANPFMNLLPVDEYLPIMFNKHPEKEWAAHFDTRNLEVYSAYPLLAHPTHYVGDEGWFSDTEPPPEILEQIRAKKVMEQQDQEERKRKEQEHQEKIKQQALQRQIEAMKTKLKSKSEL